ncbi:cupin domain-containing protein [Agromyces archimandritae]|uniref:Cupin domain-containing protein n=1 Tax=Agromyces archimandritae TaxID=2781962 RepID=A0A975IMU3_9MICO|nr:cupin domain-containing protein [Agromyces archimandritae]QTX03830.1 cupin domain-containing protein [Agromyces archimandritae]
MDYTTQILIEPSFETPPPEVIPAEALAVGDRGTRRFVGRDHGAGASYFFVDYEEIGFGPTLHWHPYAETWVVLGGTPRITIGEHELTAAVGDTVTAPAGIWHRFVNAGPGRLRMLCIHASPVIIQTFADAQE